MNGRIDQDTRADFRAPVKSANLPRQQRPELLVWFKSGFYEEDVERAVREYVRRQGLSLGFVVGAEVRAPPGQTAWHRGGRPDDEYPDDELHATVWFFGPNGNRLFSHHVYPNGTGTRDFPDRRRYINGRSSTRPSYGFHRPAKGHASRVDQIWTTSSWRRGVIPQTGFSVNNPAGNAGTTNNGTSNGVQGSSGPSR